MADFLLWMLYDQEDYLVNQDFGALVTREARQRRMDVRIVLTEDLTLGVDENGAPTLLLCGLPAHLPDAALSRQRDAMISRQLEKMGVWVLNDSHICEICNDKRKTHLFLSGHDIPMMETTYFSSSNVPAPQNGYPYILKPAGGHGGDRVALAQNQEEWRAAAASILPQEMLCQAVASDVGKDLRVYVLFGQIVAAVLRTAKSGYISNFKRGGDVALYPLSPSERAAAQHVVDVFTNCGMELCMAGVDFLFDRGRMVLSEVEDVVGSRMLYQVSDLNFVGLYLDEVRVRLTARIRTV